VHRGNVIGRRRSDWAVFACSRPPTARLNVTVEPFDVLVKYLTITSANIRLPCTSARAVDDGAALVWQSPEAHPRWADPGRTLDFFSL